jgi:hypothetical protein
MADPVTISVIAIGSVMLLTSIAVAMGVALSPAVSSPEDKYLYRDGYRLSYERMVGE